MHLQYDNTLMYARVCAEEWLSLGLFKKYVFFSKSPDLNFCADLFWLQGVLLQHLFKMTSKATAGKQGVQKLNNIQKQGPNCVLIAGGALLSTLTIKLGCKLKQAFEMGRNAKQGFT